MWTEESEIIDAIEHLGVQALLLGKDDSREVVEVVMRRFCDSKASRSRRAFECFINCVSKRGESLACKLSSIVSGSAVFVFAEPESTARAFRFENGQDVGRVLEECANFSTYVVPVDFNYVLCLTAEGVLVGCGDLDKLLDWEN